MNFGVRGKVESITNSPDVVIGNSSSSNCKHENNLMIQLKQKQTPYILPGHKKKTVMKHFRKIKEH